MGKFRNYLRDPSGGTISDITSSATINDNSWHHFAITRSGATVSIYIDGVLDTAASTSGTIDVSDTAGSLELGTIGFGHCARYYIGLIDEFRSINTTAFSADRVRAEYNNQFSSSTFAILI